LMNTSGICLKNANSSKNEKIEKERER